MTDQKTDGQRHATKAKLHSTTTMEPHSTGTAEAGKADKLPTLGSPDTGAEQVTQPTTKPK